LLDVLELLHFDPLAYLPGHQSDFILMVVYLGVDEFISFLGGIGKGF
jgi:hypothetical protein